MPVRRRNRLQRAASQALGATGDFLGRYFQGQQQNRLLTERKTVADALDELRALDAAAGTGEISEEDYARRLSFITARLPEGSVDPESFGDPQERFSAFQPSRDRRIGMALAPFDEATDLEALAGAGPRLRRRLSELGFGDDFRLDRILPPDLSEALSFPDLKRSELQGAIRDTTEAETTPQQITGIGPEGVEQTRFVNPFEMARTGDAVTTERTADQEADRTLGSEFRPDVVDARVSEAERTARAQARARLQEELSQVGITGQQQQAALSLSDDFFTQTKGFYELQSSFRRLAQLSQNPSPASDVGIVFSYMKMLDPTSTVREGEQAQARDATGVPGRVLNLYNRLIAGENLNDEQRADFARTAGVLYENALEEHQELSDLFTDRAQRLRVPPELVIRPPVNALDTLRNRGR